MYVSNLAFPQVQLRAHVSRKSETGSPFPSPSHPAATTRHRSPQGFALLHNSYRWTTFFQLHFAAGAMINLARCIYVSREKGLDPARGLLKRAMVATALAGFCWMVRMVRPGSLTAKTLVNEPTTASFLHSPTPDRLGRW